MGHIKKDLRRFSVSCCVVKLPLCILSDSKYQFLSQAPQAQNTWCMRQLVYVDNCMGK